MVTQQVLEKVGGQTQVLLASALCAFIPIRKQKHLSMAVPAYHTNSKS